MHATLTSMQRAKLNRWSHSMKLRDTLTSSERDLTIFLGFFILSLVKVPVESYMSAHVLLNLLNELWKR